MGGGDLNMKKSWHPLLQKNQERVWQEENRAREERKRIEQKRKEIAEERQVQELRRLQEQQGGKRTVERLDWMYAAPGSGGQNTSESMEAYLLGKKKVDELITGDENEKLKKGGDIGFVATQNANSATDTRNKVLNDPLLAIKRQEQRQFEELMKNPLRLKQMKKELEKAKGGKDKSHRHRDSHRDSGRSERHNSERHRDSDRGVKRHRDRDDDSYRSSKSRRYEDRSRPEIKREHDDRYHDRYRDRSPARPSSHRSPARPSSHRSPRIKRESETPTRDSPTAEDARAAALQAMLSNAEDLESSRAVRLAALEAKETAESEREELERLKKKALGGRAGFMKDMQGRILEEGRMAAAR
jgi:hypothetical protein